MAGPSPDRSVTFTAIALAESRGDHTHVPFVFAHVSPQEPSHNPVGEDSHGLWQINARPAEGTDVVLTHETEGRDTIEIIGHTPPVFDFFF